jgi:hypothetical protein
MDAIDRRSALRSLLCGVVAAGLGAGLLADSAEAAPLAMQKDPGKKSGDFKEEAQVVVTRPRPVPYRGRHPHWRRRRPRRVCYWRRGRRVCVYR